MNLSELIRALEEIRAIHGGSVFVEDEGGTLIETVTYNPETKAVEVRG